MQNSHIQNAQQLNQTKWFAYGLHKALDLSCFSKILALADPSISPFARNLLKFKYLGCILLVKLLMEIKGNMALDSATRAKVLDSHVSKDIFYMIFYHRSGKANSTKKINLD